jgi:nucleoside-diphosphate-sugar epimerase
MSGDFDVVTGAFSYSGAVIARELQAAGRRVRTLTGHPGRAPADTEIGVRPLDFADPAGAARGRPALIALAGGPTRKPHAAGRP